MPQVYPYALLDVTPNPLGDPPALPGRQPEFDIFWSNGSCAGEKTPHPSRARW